MSDDDVELEAQLARLLRLHDYVPQGTGDGALSPIALFQTDLTVWFSDGTDVDSISVVHREREDIQARLASLTEREQQVLSGVVAGRLNKQIASEMGIAERTVKIHRGRVMAKMAAASLAELVRLCERVGR
ncbi:MULTISPECIES: response regulator transcription factor [Ramlibacter]|uniref:response regulator transcription factor n=1 Tax=Ramlibacter TaxID=174951 RepID=UPI001E3430A6|nr:MULTISPECIES: LuxR C-terminal-related transcriptional regulator [Ramlibacter]